MLQKYATTTLRGVHKQEELHVEVEHRCLRLVKLCEETPCSSAVPHVTKLLCSWEVNDATDMVMSSSFRPSRAPELM